MKFPNLFGRLSVCAMLPMIVSCISCAKSESGADRKIRIGMMPKLVGISYFDATGQGAREAARELGLDLVYDGPTEARSDDQAKMLDGWVAQGFDVVAVAANDPEAISSTLRNARESNVTVITWDTDANPAKSKRQLFVNQAQNEKIGQALVDVMMEQVLARGQAVAGKYLVVSGTPTAANQNTWMKIMRDYISDKYAGVEILPVLMPGEDQRNAQEQTAEAIAAHPDLRGIWGITSVALPAAARACRDAGKTQEMVVTGLSLPSLMREYVEDGSVERFVLWDAVALGYLSVHVAARSHASVIPDGTYDFGRLKGIEVHDGQAILGLPLIFDKNNIGTYRF